MYHKMSVLYHECLCMNFSFFFCNMDSWDTDDILLSITDKSGRIIYVNKKFCDTSQYTKDEILNFIDNKSYKQKDIKILGIDHPVFHELIRVPNRASLGLDESETRMDLVVDLKYLENLAIPFEEDKDGEYI